MIRLRGVELTLPGAAGPVHILKGIDLDVESGEAVAITGRSGAGKSSLLAVITGIERASAGSLRVAGTELSELDEDALARFRRDHLGILFQFFHLVPTMTARENVAPSADPCSSTSPPAPVMTKFASAAAFESSA